MFGIVIIIAVGLAYMNDKWDDSEGHDSPHDLAWFLRDAIEDLTETTVSEPVLMNPLEDVDYVTSVARTQDGSAFLVKFKTGTRLKVTVTTAEPSHRFYPEEGEPDERERKEFEETFEEEKL